MSEGRGTVREIVWLDVCPWLILGRAFRLAVSFRVLALAAAGAVAMTAGWRISQDLFSSSEDEWLQPRANEVMPWPWERAEGERLETFAPLESSNRYASDVPLVGPWLIEGPMLRIWREISVPFLELFDRGLTIWGIAFLFLCCGWAALIWGLFGGAITRIAALTLAREEPLGMFAAIGFARSRLGGYFTAPLLPLAGLLLAAFPLWVLGLAMRVDFFVALAGLVWFVVLLIGVFMAILALGLLFGWPLMAPTISTEGSDSFDALSRSYAYVSQRPLHYLFYVAVASLLGLLGILVVDIFAEAILYLSMLAISWGTGAERVQQLMNPGEEDRLLSAGVTLIHFWQGFVLTFAYAFRYAFFWTAASAIYLLLRRGVDATEMDEVYLEAQAEAYSLPPLETDAAGVPGVADDAE